MLKDPPKNSNLSLKEGRAVKIGEASKFLGLHIDTLRRWEKSGKITPVRTPGGTRLYSLDELESLVPKVLDNSSQPPSAKQLPLKNLHRIEGEDIYVHAYNKGVEKKIIFCDGEDYQVFIGFLQDYLTAPKPPESIKKDFTVHGQTFRGTPYQPKNYFNNVELIAYSLMPNHFHLLLHQKTRGSLESFIRSLCTRYSMYFNKKYQRAGALFEGPYKSVQIKEESCLLHLTGYLHHTSSYSSYPEYLGSRETSWVKAKVAQSFFDKVKIDLSKEIHSYKDFVEKYELNQKEKVLPESITFESETQHLERRDLERNDENYPPEIPTEPSEKIHVGTDLKPARRIPEFLATTVVFLLLLTLGIRNIMASTTKSPKPLPPPIQSGTTPAVLSATKKVKPTAEPTIEPTAEPKVMLTIKINDGATSVIIRQKPTTNSERIGIGNAGDTFEFVSIDSGWYGVKLADGSTGFVPAKYVKRNDK